MLTTLARKLFGTHNDRVLRAQNRTLERINALEPDFIALSDAELASKTLEFRQRLVDGASLDSLLPEAFATVREAARRVLGQRHFDVQLRGGMVLNDGKIAEMRTGEGKTLVATLPVYLNALSGKGVHVVTINDYLASRDSEWMGQIYRFLGMTVSCVIHGLSDDERRAAYAADITYGTNHEFGFDYLRDNMKFSLSDMCQRPFNYAIVDEVDSILIDEARTPLIISGPAEDSSELYRRVDALIPNLDESDYEKDEKNKTVVLTESGNDKMEQLLTEVGLLTAGGGMYDTQNIAAIHHVNQALRAHKMFMLDVDYIVKAGKVVLIDEFTGRMMDGRRFSDGLHQALEAKEKVEVQRENQTLASITFQNYFRLYPKLSGMTGTALTEAAEFAEIYNLEVVDIPTNMPVARADLDDEIYGTMAEKYDALVAAINDCLQRKQPVLVGTVSIEKSETLAAILQKHNIPHSVLNARYHEQEAAIVAQAGRPGSITIATNMAGRGTDIKLGGNLEMRLADELRGIEDETEQQAKTQEITQEIAAAKAEAQQAGGLFIIGTERHESRRIDNQLRGRSGRQGDPGASRFYLSLEDDLMRIFGMEKAEGILSKLGLRDGQKIAHPWISTLLQRAQHKVEARNFDIRKNLLKYDNIMNNQRRVIYDQRREIMSNPDISDMVRELRDDVIAAMVASAIPPHSYHEQWDIVALTDNVKRVLGLDLPLEEWAQRDGVAESEITEEICKAAAAVAAGKEEQMGAESMRRAEKAAVLGTLDQAWKDHLLALDHLRQGIHLRGYGQRDPLNEYSREAFDMFRNMLDYVREEATRVLMHAEARLPTLEEYIARRRRELEEMHALNPEEARVFEGLMNSGDSNAAQPAAPAAAPRPSPVHTVFDARNPDTWHSVPRNALCPCGSGRKYKHCHGAMQ